MSRKTAKQVLGQALYQTTTTPSAPGTSSAVFPDILLVVRVQLTNIFLSERVHVRFCRKPQLPQQVADKLLTGELTTPSISA
jgi:hypothetical protein